MITQHLLRRLGKEFAILKNSDALGEDCQFRQRFLKTAHDLVTQTQCATDLSEIRCCLDSRHKLPKIQRISQMLVWTWREIGMQRNRGCSMLCEMPSNGILSCKPLGALPWPIAILNDSRHQCVRKSQNKGAAVLQHLTPIRGDAVGYRRFRGGADG